MTVVCDTSPLCYLILIDDVEVLPQLFGRVIIPNAVCTELLAEGSYTQVQNWIAQPLHKSYSSVVNANQKLFNQV